MKIRDEKDRKENNQFDSIHNSYTSFYSIYISIK